MKNDNKLTFLTKTFFGAGEIPGTTSKTMMGMLFMYFLTDVVGILPALAGTIFMIGRAWDGITDPFMGIISDRTRTRFGRRRPYFLIAAVPLGLFFFAMFNSFPLAAQWSKMAVYTTLYILYMTAITVFTVPYLGLMAELTDDYTERTSVNNYRMFFSFIFGLCAAVLPKMLIDSYDNKEQGFMIAALLVGIFIMIVPFLVFRATHERYEKAPKSERLKVFSEFKTALSNKSFRSLIIIYMASFAAINVIEGFVVYYMKYWIGREKEMPILFVSVVLASVITLPLWSVFSKKIGKKKTLIFGTLFWSGSQFFWLFLSPASSLVTICIVGALVGVGYGCAHTLPWAMLPDVLDYDELRTGERREGIYSGIMTFLMKMGNSLAMFLIGLILQAVGYVPNVEQTGIALETMRLTMAFAPMSFLIVCLIALFVYPITKETYLNIRRELDGKKALTSG
jgi:sugar (glycoside-pentoside-hexuronide) transporter